MLEQKVHEWKNVSMINNKSQLIAHNEIVVRRTNTRSANTGRSSYVFESACCFPYITSTGCRMLLYSAYVISISYRSSNVLQPAELTGYEALRPAQFIFLSFSVQHQRYGFLPTSDGSPNSQDISLHR